MIEVHYFRGRMVRVYDFTFGFCIPNSTNSWEAIYVSVDSLFQILLSAMGLVLSVQDVPAYTKQQIEEYVSTDVPL